MLKAKSLIITLIFLTSSLFLSGQSIDSVSVNMNTRLSFYSGEKNAEILFRLPPSLRYAPIDITIRNGTGPLTEWSGVPGKEIIRVNLNMSETGGSFRLFSEIKSLADRSKIYLSSCKLVVLRHKPNEVKIDRYTGGMIVNKRQFFPFGFYCYSPVHPTLPEEEVVKGFNFMSPYQRVMPSTLADRRAYMDRCAQLGMKVHYNLVSVAGGGGVNSQSEGYSERERRAMLIDEIKTFMDHPALLAWYIADEPNGNNVSPATIKKIYDVVRSTDPWHPVSVVFMTPFTPAKDYAEGLDIVMADPYPVPVYPPAMAGNAAALLKKEFAYRKPVWIVPQAFGGGEHWQREPTLQEMRSMTWQAIIRGATGIQYFIRHGLNSFPKSTAAWNECGRISLEVHSLVPWLLSDEETVSVTSSSAKILVTSRLYKGQLVIMAANTENEPLNAEIRIGNYFSGKAELIFENRSVRVSAGVISDIIDAFGTRVYRITLQNSGEKISPWTGNLVADHSFEDSPSPGIPSSCYARPGGDRGATYFLDPRESVDGNHSLRLVTPSEGNSMNLRFFPVKVKAGASYLLSVWAKADPEQRLKKNTLPDAGVKSSLDISPQYAEAGLGGFGISRFVPTAEWKQFVTIVTIPADTVPELKTNILLRMPGQGVAWFDMLQLIEDPAGRNNNLKTR